MIATQNKEHRQAEQCKSIWCKKLIIFIALRPRQEIQMQFLFCILFKRWKRKELSTISNLFQMIQSKLIVIYPVYGFLL